MGWVLAAAFLMMSTIFGWNWFRSAPWSARHDLAVAQRLAAHVRVLSSEIGIRDLEHADQLRRAERYIVEQFSQAGYIPTSHEYTAVAGISSRNLIAERPGREPEEPLVIVGAHYDSCGTPGADDNASGVASLLELARALDHAQYRRTVRFIAFVNEEPPFFQTDLMGSRVYARELKRQGGRVRAMLSLETLDYARMAAVVSGLQAVIKALAES